MQEPWVVMILMVSASWKEEEMKQNVQNFNKLHCGWCCSNNGRLSSEIQMKKAIKQHSKGS